MIISFDPKLPIYTQIVDVIKRKICSGELAPGERMPAVREMSLEIGVNPNTLQRAMSDLERDGLLFTERTAGRFVTNDEVLIKKIRNDMKVQEVSEFVKKMKELGCSFDDVEEQLKSEMKGD